MKRKSITMLVVIATLTIASLLKSCEAKHRLNDAENWKLLYQLSE